MPSLILEAGTTQLSCFTMMAFLILVNISAIGSVTVTPTINYISLPARFSNAGQFGIERESAETYTADTKLAHIGARSTTNLAPAVLLDREFWGPL
jgi:hypothetical protein